MRVRVPPPVVQSVHAVPCPSRWQDQVGSLGIHRASIAAGHAIAALQHGENIPAAAAAAEAEAASHRTPTTTSSSSKDHHASKTTEKQLRAAVGTTLYSMPVYRRYVRTYVRTRYIRIN